MTQVLWCFSLQNKQVKEHLESFPIFTSFFFFFTWDNCQHLNLSLPHKGKHPSCERQCCTCESQKMFLNWIHSFVRRRRKKKKNSWFLLFFFSHMYIANTFLFSSSLASCVHFCPAQRGMLWSRFSLRLLVFHWAAVKKTAFFFFSFFCSLSWTKIEGEGRRRGSK